MKLMESSESPAAPAPTEILINVGFEILDKNSLKKTKFSN